MEIENLALKKRFTPERQQQIDGVLSYLFMLGLDGKDLIAIGNKIEREKQRQLALSLKNIIKSYEVTPLNDFLEPIYTYSISAASLTPNFRLRVKEQDYVFKIVNPRKGGGWAEFEVIGPTRSDRYTINWYESFRRLNTRNATLVESIRWAIILDIHAGLVKLPA